jgi:hypothetical protein
MSEAVALDERVVSERDRIRMRRTVLAGTINRCAEIANACLAAATNTRRE